MNDFVVDQNSYAAKYNENPMWLSLFKIEYDDFEVDESYKSYLHSMACQFAVNLYESYSDWAPQQIIGTETQAGSDVWFAERRFRVTASICKRVMRLGENLDRRQCYFWLEQSFWFKRKFTSQDMQYGINEEPNAIAAYSQVTGNEVHQSGLWVRKGYIYLAATPDGLLLDSFRRVRGIVEVKCLKALRTKTVQEWIKSGVPTNACVRVSNDRLELKMGH